LTIDIVEDGKILAVMCEDRMDGGKSKHMPLSQSMACCTMNVSGLQTRSRLCQLFFHWKLNMPVINLFTQIDTSFCSESSIKLIVPKTKQVPKSV
jgi:hypothetical protein